MRCSDDNAPLSTFSESFLEVSSGMWSGSWLIAVLSGIVGTAVVRAIPATSLDAHCCSYPRMQTVRSSRCLLFWHLLHVLTL